MRLVNTMGTAAHFTTFSRFCSMVGSWLIVGATAVLPILSAHVYAKVGDGPVPGIIAVWWTRPKLACVNASSLAALWNNLFDVTT